VRFLVLAVVCVENGKGDCCKIMFLAACGRRFSLDFFHCKNDKWGRVKSLWRPVKNWKTFYFNQCPAKIEVKAGVCAILGKIQNRRQELLAQRLGNSVIGFWTRSQNSQIFEGDFIVFVKIQQCCFYAII
jgi:hypothetical protein